MDPDSLVLVPIGNEPAAPVIAEEVDLPGISANAGENGPRPVRRPTNPGMLAPKNGRAEEVGLQPAGQAMFAGGADEPIGDQDERPVGERHTLGLTERRVEDGPQPAIPGRSTATRLISPILTLKPYVIALRAKKRASSGGLLGADGSEFGGFPLLFGGDCAPRSRRWFNASQNERGDSLLATLRLRRIPQNRPLRHNAAL